MQYTAWCGQDCMKSYHSTMDWDKNDAAPQGAEHKELKACKCTKILSYGAACMQYVHCQCKTFKQFSNCDNVLTKSLHSQVHCCICASQPYKLCFIVSVCRQNPACKASWEPLGSTLCFHKAVGAAANVSFTASERALQCSDGICTPLGLVEFLGPRGPSEKAEKKQYDHTDGRIQADRNAKAARVRCHRDPPSADSLLTSQCSLAASSAWRQARRVCWKLQVDSAST